MSLPSVGHALALPHLTSPHLTRTMSSARSSIPLSLCVTGPLCELPYFLHACFPRPYCFTSHAMLDPVELNRVQTTRAESKQGELTGQTSLAWSESWSRTQTVQARLAPRGVYYASSVTFTNGTGGSGRRRGGKAESGPSVCPCVCASVIVCLSVCLCVGPLGTPYRGHRER